jgi:hypothetical protein
MSLNRLWRIMGVPDWLPEGNHRWNGSRLRHRPLLCDHGYRRRLPSLASPQCHQIVERTRAGLSYGPMVVPQIAQRACALLTRQPGALDKLC